MECRYFRKGRAAFLLRKRKNRRFHLWEAVLVLRAKGSEEVNTLPNIVLVHGAWADGSSWSGVIEHLQADGYHVTAPQFPLTQLSADVARLRQVLARQNGPTIVARHSYGGQIMTAPGPDPPNVVRPGY